MPLQIVAQRLFPGAKKPVFVFLNYQCVTAQSIPSLFANYPSIVAHFPEGERWNLYYTLAHHSGLSDPSGPPSKPQRSNATFEYQTILAWDLDYIDSSRIAEYPPIVAEILGVPENLFTLVHSGNGLHLILNLQHPIRNASYFEENREAYAEILRQIAAGLKSKGLPGKPDPAIFDAARVFRLPGTLNKKPKIPDQECRLLQVSQAQVTLDLMHISGITSASKENISRGEVIRAYPTPDFKEIAKECLFVNWALHNPKEVHEPQAFDLFSILSTQPEDVKIELNGIEYLAKEAGQKVFSEASSSASLAGSDFEDKWEQSSRYGVRKCSTIDAHWDKGCKSCPHWQKIPTPLAIKSKEHLGSEANGYWVMTKKGYAHPNYEELTLKFFRENHVVVTSEERIFTFNGTHYEETSDLTVKSWLNKVMVPSHPIRETHRNEFLAWLRAAHAVPAQQKDDLFITSIKGKLNCKNGVLNLRTGKVEPHSHKFGFLNILPYNYYPEIKSEFFMDWLDKITRSRPELNESLLDILSYCLWPTYDDHIFVFFTGSGGNGKSTLIDVMRAMLGGENVAAISIQQLTRNKFSPAMLEGKMVNLSEENNGKELSSEEIGRIKDLSAGGEMQVERKNQNPFNMRNSAKLIFSANEPPRFLENGEALKRRLVVIPFDYKITDEDPKIKHKLIAEVPGILAILVDNIQRNLAANGGEFKCFRGGETAVQAREKMIYTGSTVATWVEESLSFGEHVPDVEFVPVRDAYINYTQWCSDNGYKNPSNMNNFGKVVSGITPPVCHSIIKRVTYQGKSQPIRLYQRMRFKGAEE